MTAYFLFHQLLVNHRVEASLGGDMVSCLAYPSINRLDLLTNPDQLEALDSHLGEPVEYHLHVITNKILHAYLVWPLMDRQTRRVVLASSFEHFDRLLVVDLEDLLKPLDLASGVGDFGA